MANQQAIMQQNLRRNVPNQALRQMRGRGEFVQKQKSYYSTVRFQFALAGGVLSMAKGQRVQSFAGAINDPASSLGFDSGFGTLTEAETNLLTRNETGGAEVSIYGISLYLGEMSDAYLTKLIWANVFADVTLNGSDRYMLLGRLGRIPAAGGLVGNGGLTRCLAPNNALTSHHQIGAITNGHPEQGNFFRLNSPLTWMSVGNIDSKFSVRYEVAHNIAVTLPATTGGYVQPAAVGAEGTFVDVTTYLHTIETAPRSIQA